MIASTHALPLAAAFFGISNAQMALLVGGVAIIYVINRWRRNTVNKQRAMDSTSAAPDSGLSARTIHAEMAGLLGEIEETARRLSAQIDNRYRRLEMLMGEADQKIARLEGLLDRAPAGPSLAPAALSAAAARPRPRPVLPRKSDAVNTEAQRVLERLREERGAPPASLDPAYKPIYALADGGKSPREIAQQLGRQPGEVELILALRQR